MTVELKNDISIRGTLKSVDQYLNIKLDDITVLEELKYPHLSSVKNIFIRYVRRTLSHGCLDGQDLSRSTEAVRAADVEEGVARRSDADWPLGAPW